MKRVAVLMAGGRSERLWPMSRVSMPKQFLDMTGSGETMIQMTARRLSPMVDLEDLYVVTSESYADIVKDQLPGLPRQNILMEPMGRDTAPCVALATAVLSEKYDDAVVLVMASDHLIEQEDAFCRDVLAAADFAQGEDALVTIGITPEYPETGYGYIQFDRQGGENQLKRVKRFVEKPDEQKAREYLDSGDYLWNSGMFIWRLSVIDRHFKELMPDVYAGMGRIRQAIQRQRFGQELPAIFADFPRISVDYGIMEKAERIYTVPSSFTWLDVGNWNAMDKIKDVDDQGNVLEGDVMPLGVKDTIVYGKGGRMISLIGVENLVVVDTDDVLLICPRDQLAKIKEMLGKLRENARGEKL